MHPRLSSLISNTGITMAYNAQVCICMITRACGGAQLPTLALLLIELSPISM